MICANLRRSVSTPSFEFQPRRDLVFRKERGGFSLTLKRNCSISPAGLACVFAALALLALAIGAGFAAAGAWLVLPFAGLEALMLGAAFLLHARHAGDYERFELAPGRLTVVVGEGLSTARYELDPGSARVVLEKDRGYGARVLLRSRAEELEIGRHLDADARVEFAAELTRRLKT